jgi:hypothetical protein
VPPPDRGGGLPSFPARASSRFRPCPRPALPCVTALLRALPTLPATCMHRAVASAAAPCRPLPGPARSPGQIAAARCPALPDTVARLLRLRCFPLPGVARRRSALPGILAKCAPEAQGRAPGTPARGRWRGRSRKREIWPGIHNVTEGAQRLGLCTVAGLPQKCS